MWQSPQAQMTNRSPEAWDRGKPKMEHSSGEPLSVQVQRSPATPAPPTTGGTWATPSSESMLAGLSKRENCKSSAIAGHVGNEMLRQAVESSPATSGPRSLNPRFVEWLMGLPLGLTACVPVEMQSYQSWRHTHLSLLRTLLSKASRSKDCSE